MNQIDQRNQMMKVFVTVVCAVTIWACLTAGVFAAGSSPLELHPSTAVPGATLTIGGDSAHFDPCRSIA
jgi:hypothetical protein